MNEFERIEHWIKHLSRRDESIKEPIGDDCALVETGGVKLLLSNDEQIEKQHFARHFPAKGVGFKLIAANVSDIYACGGEPLWINLSVALPPELPDEWMLGFYEGVKAACERYRVSITGGNTTASDTLSLGAFIVGRCERFVSRRGANATEALMITGPLGESRAGLEHLLAQKSIQTENDNRLVKSHLYPDLPSRQIDFIARNATAAIDISDGLAGDLGHLIEKSGVGFLITDPEKLYSDALLSFCQDDGKQALKYALYGGEDYQIAFTLPATHAQEAQKLGALHIGTVTDNGKLQLSGPKGEIELPIRGFAHF
jgi:thiamine-monophosphate kinase